MTPAVFNAMPFAVQCMLIADQHGQLLHAALVCATFEFDADGMPVPAAVQPPLPLADEPFGAPGRSSIRRDSAATPSKPALDVLVKACAHAPGGRPVEQLVVGVRIGAWTKLLRVSGDRDWSGVLHDRPSAPRPFAVMPICYERAFGGSVFDAEGQLLACHAPNPVGIGFHGARSMAPSVASEVPNIELPSQPLATRDDGCPVAGYGVIARHWQPRVQHGGTYDKHWLETRCPILPPDFDLRFHQAAPLDQQFAQTLAGEEVVLRHLTPEGTWRFRMPALEITVRLLGSTGVAAYTTRVDTIYIDADAKTVSLVARHCLADIRRMGVVRDIVFGDTTPGWMRSRTREKIYLGRSAPATA